MSGFAEVQLDLVEKREALPDECQALGEEISNLAGVIDELENKLSFVLSAQTVHKEAKHSNPPEFDSGRSDSSALMREYRFRLVHLVQGLWDIVHRLDL